MDLLAIAGWAVLVLFGLVLGGVVYARAYAGWASRRWPADGRMLDTPGGPVHVVETGEGTPIVLVHGSSANERELRSTLEAPLVAAGFRVVAIDRPGFGGSPPFRAGHRLKAHARAVAGVIEALGLKQPIVLGHSYGGAVGLTLALERPGLAGGYLLLSAASHGDVGPVAWYNHIGAVPGLGWLFARTAVPTVGPLLAPGGMGASFAPQPAPDGHAEASGVGLLFRPETFEANSHDLAQVNPEMRAQQDRYGEIDAPVTLIAGDADRTVLTPRHSGRTAEAIAGAKLIVLPDVGHMPHHAAPEAIAEQAVALRERIAMGGGA